MERSNPGRFEENVGGASFNVASVFAQLGGNAALISILGEDLAAELICNTAKARGFSHQHQTSQDFKTASYTSIMQPNGELVIALADTQIYDEFKAAPCLPQIKSMKNTDWICLDANLPGKEIMELIESAPCSVAALSVSAAKAHRLNGVSEHLDLLFTNRAEALAMLQLPNETSSEALAGGLSARGIKRAVLSDGSKEVWLVDHGNISALAVSPPQDIIDTTGAGDALAGASLFAIGKGAALIEAVKFGIIAANKILQVRGPFHEDLARLLEGELHL